MVIFGLSIGMTAQAFVRWHFNTYFLFIFLREKNDGTLDRLYAAGVTSLSVVLGNTVSSEYLTYKGALFSHQLVLIVQVVLMLIILLLGFGFNVVGSIGLLFLFVLLLGLDGMGFGLLIASVSSTG